MSTRQAQRSSNARRGQSGRFGRKPQRGVVEFFTRPERHIVWRVLGFAVRVRAELCLITVMLVVWFVASGAFGPNATLIGMAAAILVVFAVPVSRRFVVRRAWCVTTRHRMRACFTQTRTMTHHGRMPFLWWSRPSPVGERVRVWLPAGLSVKDLQQVTAELATACWARETRITPARRSVAFVRVDIVRRDPLAASKPFTPTVADRLDDTDHDDRDGTVVPLPDRSTVSNPAPPDRPDTNGRKRSTRSDQHDSDPELTGFGGIDVSDYV